MKLIAALGNPGEKYLKTRHNAGFLFLDHLVDFFSLPEYQPKFKGALTEGTIQGHKLYFLKPLTFMNVSGQSVAALAQFFKIPPEEILVIHDDLDIEFGKIRVKQGGSSGGHNGIKNIEQMLGSPNFWRLRIGIGRPLHAEDVSNYVLNDFDKRELEDLVPLYDKMAEHFPKLLEAMETYVPSVLGEK
ncbi:MAG: aminoacyl-tRNA hydrolase [Alphaproteobacteria bacterium RIFCSPLOWO2_01_FULL_45_8]|nr:MAG: aminoacyl-tRNA hydrolase [Alphaproteobacteria bacterium GWB1_45_5]OFW76714.1 MAG: aminoacyl-tRNA hydrolase [Alphaproteobacteria bacterium GWA1_45_9]OFW89795.1 MAG: aminoacyl-tRNA hydrolase [Alphaproteobacteria bacterium RIFCSPHIGHO2_01_FULL_41_14]OFW95931.1 MAG: aminoacyl-tRNA hydrolase [Alphaproteobacteria bacterium RIFCSPLOWO2_01_FULL_45_8]HCI48925.1 aminoacyl-tRNA hydrolase [Holosporales bacterium]